MLPTILLHSAGRYKHYQEVHKLKIRGRGKKSKNHTGDFLYSSERKENAKTREGDFAYLCRNEKAI